MRLFTFIKEKAIGYIARTSIIDIGCWSNKMKVTIRNFRGIRKLEIEILDGITVIIGKNDSGKSSILEAIYLGLTAFNGFRGSFIEYMSPAYLLMRRNTRINSLIFYGEQVGEISITINEQKFDIRISPEIDKLALDIKFRNELARKIEELSSKSMEAMRGYNAMLRLFANIFQAALTAETEGAYPIPRTFTPFTEIPPKLQKMFGTFSSRGEIYSYFILYTIDSYPMMAIEVKRKSDLNVNVIFMDFASRRPIDELNRFLSETIRKGLKDEIVKSMRIGNEQIESIDLAMEDGRVVPLIKYSWSKGGIPLELSGDGLKTLLAIELASRVLNKHYVLLEEPENHMHPKLISTLAKLLIEHSERGVKYVIATHSIELLKEILSVARDRNVDVNVYYLERLSSGDIRITRYEKEVAIIKVVDLEMDLRR